MIDASKLRVITELYPQEKKQLVEETKKVNRIIFNNIWSEEKQRGEQETESLIPELVRAAQEGKNSYTLPIYACDFRHFNSGEYSDNPIRGTEQDLARAYEYAVSDGSDVTDQPIIVTQGILSAIGPAKRVVYDTLAAQGFTIVLQFTTPEYMEMVISW